MGLLKRKKEYILSPTCQIQKLDKIFERFLGFKKDGVFVEFGAYDGEYVSNTSGLADMGWTGLYIEPVQEYFEQCRERHKKNKKVQVVNLAVGDEPKEVEISIGGPLSTISKETLDRFNELDWAKGYHKGQTQMILQQPLGVILSDNGIPKQFDVMSVDVEGYEWQALKSFPIDEWLPKLVIIELHDNNLDYPHEWEEADKLVDYFETVGYRVVYKDLSNTIYYHK